jgi:hypothetical protein
MRFAFIVVAFIASLFLFGCIMPGVSQPVAQPSTGSANMPDKMWYSGAINSTGTYGNVSLGSAMYRHVFSIWTTFGTTLVNTSTFTANATRTCYNSTVAWASASNCVVNTTILAGTTNFTVNASASAFYMDLNTTNAYLNNSTSTFELDIAGAYLNADTSRVGISLFGYPSGVYEPTGYFLADNTTNWTNITGLSKARYVTSAGVVAVRLDHPDSGDNATSQAISVHYLAIVGNYTYNITGAGNSTVVFQTSLDNQNWFTDQTVTNISSTAARYQTNNTALYARFNVTGITVPNQGDALYIQYVAVSN